MVSTAFTSTVNFFQEVGSSIKDFFIKSPEVTTPAITESIDSPLDTELPEIETLEMEDKVEVVLDKIDSETKVVEGNSKQEITQENSEVKQTENKIELTEVGQSGEVIQQKTAEATPGKVVDITPQKIDEVKVQQVKPVIDQKINVTPAQAMQKQDMVNVSQIDLSQTVRLEDVRLLGTQDSSILDVNVTRKGIFLLKDKFNNWDTLSGKLGFIDRRSVVGGMAVAGVGAGIVGGCVTAKVASIAYVAAPATGGASLLVAVPLTIVSAWSITKALDSGVNIAAVAAGNKDLMQHDVTTTLFGDFWGGLLNITESVFSVKKLHSAYKTLNSWGKAKTYVKGLAESIKVYKSGRSINGE